MKNKNKKKNLRRYLESRQIPPSGWRLLAVSPDSKTQKAPALLRAPFRLSSRHSDSRNVATIPITWRLELVLLDTRRAMRLHLRTGNIA